MFVLDGHIANLILVAARTVAGVSLFVGDGRRRRPHPHRRSPRWTRPASRRRLAFSASRPPSSAPTAVLVTPLERVLDLAAVALAAEQVGGAQACLDMSVEIRQGHVQFGHPIGSFQAIKHKCADMLLEVESAKSAAYYAGWCAAELNDELPSVASLAKAYCSEAYFHAAPAEERPDPRRHRVHVGASRAPLLQAGQVVRAAVRRPHYHHELLAQRIGI